MHNNYVISLKSATDRREHIIKEFKSAGVDFIFFDAITPSQDFINNFNLKLNTAQKTLSDGEVACLLSHLSLWQKAVDNNLDYITVFEDDIYLGVNASSFLSNYDWIPKQCHLIKLEAFKKYRPMNQKKLSVSKKRQLGILLEKNLGAAGYIISKQLAKELLSYVKAQTALPALDYLLFDPYYMNEIKLFTQANEQYKIYQMQPALCVQDMNLPLFSQKKAPIFSTQIQRDFSKNKKLYNEQNNLKSKFKKELHKALYRKKDTIEWK